MSPEQILGLATGIGFGFLLQRGGVVRFEKQVGMLLLKDMTVLRFMLAAILVGMAGIIILAHVGFLPLSHKPMNVGGVVIGASLFGIGWAVTGLCPGTSVGALGEGRMHAIFTILGMLAGAMLFAHTYDFLKATVLSWKDFGKIGLAETIGIPELLMVPMFWLAAIFLLRAIDKQDL